MIAAEDRQRPRAERCAASSISRSSSISTGCTVRITNGSVTNSSASTTPVRRVRDVDRRSGRSAVEGEQRQPGDDRRQRERQVDERVDEAACPGTSSRTRTQAMSVPMTTLISATTKRDDERQLQRRDRLGGGDRVPEARPSRPRRGLPHHRRERQQNDDRSGSAMATPCRAGGPAGLRARGFGALPRDSPAEPPQARSIVAMIPSLGSKNLS